MKVVKVLGMLMLGYVACSWVYGVWTARIPVPAEFAKRAGRLTPEMEFRDVLQVFDGYAVIVAKPVKADLEGCSCILREGTEARHLLMFAKLGWFPTPACGVYFGADRKVAGWEFGEDRVFARTRAGGKP